MGLFDNIYRLYNDPAVAPDFLQDPANMDMVDFGPGDEFTRDGSLPPSETPSPRMIPPTMRSYARPGFDTYLKHIQEMPQESDFEPGLGRKIAAGLIGFSAGLHNPAAGYAASEQILRSPYTRALSDWQTKGKELSSLAQEEGKYIGNLSDENVESGKLGARYGELKAKVDQINKNYDIALKNAKTAEERNKIQEQRNRDLKAASDEANKTGRIEANAAAIRAGAYKTWVDQQPGPGEGRVIPPKIGDMQESEQDILLEMLQESPELMNRFYQFNKDTGFVDPILGKEDMTPEDLATLESIKAMIGARAQRRLSGQSLGGAPTIRPRVVPPPNRRRNP